MKLNIGAGLLWRKAVGYEGLDVIDYGQKYVGDVFELLKTFPNESIEEVLASHFLEHFNQDDLKIIFKEVHRILIPDGTFKIIVPDMRKEKAWVLSHKTFWNKTTILWLERQDQDGIYGFGKWKVEYVFCNRFKNINALLKKL